VPSTARVTGTTRALVAAVVGLVPAIAGAQSARMRSRAPREEGTVVRTDATTERTAGSLTARVGALAAVPRADATEILTLAPGLSLSNESTSGDPPEVYLRGFAGDNGRDIAFSVAGIPMNDESHPRTHGSADVFFVIPELVEQLNVVSGVADPRQGNFALAGSVDFRLGLERRGVTARTSLGSHGQRRFAALFGPREFSSRSFVGAEVVHSDGFGPSRSFDRACGMAQHVLPVGNDAEIRIIAAGYHGRWQNAGVLRQDDFDAGRIRFFDTYPGTGRQGGHSTRALLGATLSWRRGSERAEFALHAQLRDTQIAENETGFYDDVQRGDLVEQRYGGATMGARGFYRRTAQVGGLAQDGEIGFAMRHDRYAVLQQNLDVASNAPVVPPNRDDHSADVRVTNPALYLDTTLRFFRWLSISGGPRFDVVGYDVDAADRDATTGEPRPRRATAAGVRAAPRATVALGPWRNVRVMLSYGQGLRSPDARTVATGEPVQFATASTTEVSLRYALPSQRARARLSASLGAFHTFVDADSAFDPTQAMSVPIGPTHRIGAVAWLRAQPLPWFEVQAWLAYTSAFVVRPSFGGRLGAGDAIPYVPSIVGRLDAAADAQVGTWQSLPLRMRGAIGVSLRGPSGLVETPSTETWVLVDGLVGVRLGAVALDLTARNLLDARWHSADFEHPSNFNPTAPVGAAAVRHFAAGAPLTALATVTLYL